MEKPESVTTKLILHRFGENCPIKWYDAAEMDVWFEHESKDMAKVFELMISNNKDIEWHKKIEKALLNIARNRESAGHREMQNHGAIDYYTFVNGAESILGELLSESKPEGVSQVEALLPTLQKLKAVDEYNKKIVYQPNPMTDQLKPLIDKVTEYTQLPEHSCQRCKPRETEMNKQFQAEFDYEKDKPDNYKELERGVGSDALGIPNWKDTCPTRIKPECKGRECFAQKTLRFIPEGIIRKAESMAETFDREMKERSCDNCSSFDMKEELEKCIACGLDYSNWTPRENQDAD